MRWSVLKPHKLENAITDHSQTPAGVPKVSQEMTMRAKRYSAVLYVPHEVRVAVPENHTDMVKFDSPANHTYQAVVRFLDESLKKIEKSVGR